MQARQTHIDGLKLIGSQLIVLHHLAAYGPVAEAVEAAAPGLMRWLYDYARMAVQIFLVLGGYLAVQGLMPAMRQGLGVLAPTLLRRYLRLALPFVAAMLLAVGCAAIARLWLQADFIPAAPTWQQMLAHALLLHGVLGVDALSAGVWYVAIDFQLYALLALLLWLGQRGRHSLPAQMLVLGTMVASLLIFNRDVTLDNWALYFFGAYGLGVAIHWAARLPRPRGWLAALALLVLLALAVDYRTRVALALVVALVLGLAEWRGRRSDALPDWLAHSVQALGRSSYALFLVHFPVLVIGNALHARLGLHGPASGIGMLLAIWLGSVLLGLWFERRVEAPLGRWFSSRRPT